jgi:hypothetical protein
MAKPKRRIDERPSEGVRPIDPDRFYRKAEILRRRLFGYSVTQFDEKVRAKEIPLINLSDSGKARGLFGRTILKLQAEIEAKASRKAG